MTVDPNVLADIFDLRESARVYEKEGMYLMASRSRDEANALVSSLRTDEEKCDERPWCGVRMPHYHKIVGGERGEESGSSGPPTDTSQRRPAPSDDQPIPYMPPMQPCCSMCGHPVGSPDCASNHD